MQSKLLQIREASNSDAPGIARLHAESWRIAYRGVLSDAYLDGEAVADRSSVWQARFRQPAANQYVALAENDGVMVGFVCVYGADDAEWGSLLENIHVSHEHQRTGIGAQLLAHVASWCAHGHPDSGMYLWVLEPNLPAQQFYQRLGAAKVGQAVWSPPDGGAVPKFRYAWRSLETLLQSARQTFPACGQPTAATEVIR